MEQHAHASAWKLQVVNAVREQSRGDPAKSDRRERAAWGETHGPKSPSYRLTPGLVKGRGRRCAGTHLAVCTQSPSLLGRHPHKESRRLAFLRPAHGQSTAPSAQIHSTRRTSSESLFSSPMKNQTWVPIMVIPLGDLFLSFFFLSLYVFL